MRKKTQEEFEKQVYGLVGNEYTFLENYKGANTNILIRHNVCNHEYSVRPSNFESGKRCPKCAGVLKYTLEDAKKKFAEMGFELLAIEYIDVLTKMPFICLKHKDKGIQYNTLSAINQGFGCTYCRYEKSANSQRISDEELIKEFKNVGLILQEHFIYKEMHDTLPCICENHQDLGVQYISYNNIKYGGQKGCVRCSYERLSDKKRMSEDDIKLLVESLDLEYVETIKQRKTIVKCICPHHRELGIQTKQLGKLKIAQGCKYCNLSHGERKISNYLNDKCILFEPQKEFQGLVGTGGGNLSYDFFINGNILCEFQGEQHEHYVKGFHKTYDDFLKQVEHDNRKRNYAFENNYKFIEIWYYDFENIEEILDIELGLLPSSFCM